MRAAGDWLERQPGERWTGCFDNGVIGDSVGCAFLAVAGDTHDRVLFALLLGEESRNAALARLWHAGDERPIDLARRAGAGRLGERRRGAPRLGNKETTGGVLVEPV